MLNISVSDTVAVRARHSTQHQHDVGSYQFGSMSHRNTSPAISSRETLHPLARAHASHMGASLRRLTYPTPASAWRLPTLGPSPRGPSTSFLHPTLLTSGGHTLSRYWDLSNKARSVACASSTGDSQQEAANDSTPSPAVSGSPVPPAVPGVGDFLGRFWLQVFFGALFGLYVIHFVSL